MGKNKKAFVPPLKAKHGNDSYTKASLMEKLGSETENLVVRKPNLQKARANISSSLIKNVVSNSDDTINELVAGPAADKATESSLSEHDGIFLRDESQKDPDVNVYEFQSSPVNLLTTENGRNKRPLQDCPKQEPNRKRSIKKKKDSSVRQGVLKDIKKMQKAMVLLREREQSLMTSSEQ